MVSFDVNLSLGRWPFRPSAAETMPELAVRLRKHGITGGLVRSAEAPFSADPEEENRRLGERCAAFPAFLPLPAVHPAYGFWKKARFTAAALYPSFHDYSLTSRAALVMAHHLAAAGTVLVLVMREEDERAQHSRCKIKPRPIAEVVAFAAAVPEATIVVLNVYGGEAVACAASNLFCDIAMVENFPALHGIPAGRLLFGSHSPFLCPGAAIAKLEGSEYSRVELQAIRRGRAEKLFGNGEF